MVFYKNYVKQRFLRICLCNNIIADRTIEKITITFGSYNKYFQLRVRAKLSVLWFFL